MKFEEFNKNSSKFNHEKVKNIIEEFENQLKQKVGSIVTLIDKDNSEFAEKFTYSKLIEALEQVKKEPWELEKNSKKLRVDGLGNIAVLYNGNPDILLYLSLKALKTHNNIVFFENTNIHNSSNYIINLINNITNKENYKANIIIKKVKNFSEICEFDKYFNCYICIGEISNFKFLNNTINKKIVYNAYGTLSLYLDDKNLKDILLEIDEYVFENNLVLDLYEEDNIENVINKINEKGENFCSIIFTKDIKKAYYFLDNVNSENVYINQNPFKKYHFCLEDKNIVKEKRIII